MKLDSPSKDQIEKNFQVDDEALLAAMASAFSLVACSDTVLDHLETARFFEIAQSSELLSELPRDHIEQTFQTISNEILTTNQSGRKRALALVGKVKANKTYRDAVISCAQVAVVSDQVIEDVEETALDAICAVLEVDPENI